ncbi:hypothetical protein EXIGLDRAFT_81694 [Exidia glandulosa HHB12029]|uniref:Uncharacterized protein n=1 Tax=Exidia glandulosa HHB12029 TaxID=1314781 RepID=A0A165HME2_EXIGL|nr:hypothetical protein EXIGLDRAFT_81694 [Exidia glandulosa HHB12029]
MPAMSPRPRPISPSLSPIRKWPPPSRSPSACPPSPRRQRTTAPSSPHSLGAQPQSQNNQRPRVSTRPTTVLRYLISDISVWRYLSRRKVRAHRRHRASSSVHLADALFPFPVTIRPARPPRVQQYLTVSISISTLDHALAAAIAHHHHQPPPIFTRNNEIRPVRTPSPRRKPDNRTCPAPGRAIAGA